MKGTTVQEELPDTEACSALLERVLASAALKRAARLQKLLVYVGHSMLQDGREHLSEHEIGCAVFGRPEGYDTSVDNIVRVYASSLRKQIESYFAGEGVDEAVVMEIPRGSYLPVFRYREVEARNAATLSALDVESVPDPVSAPFIPQPASRRAWIGVCALIVVLTMACIALWIQNATMRHSFYAWHYKPAVATFWSRFLNRRPDTDIVLGDSSFLLVQFIAKQPFPFQEYLSHDYLNHLPEATNPDTRAALNLIASKNLASLSDFRLAQRILALDPLGKNIHLYSARDYMPSLIKQNNVVLIGSPIANPWGSIFASRLNFATKSTSDAPTFITNRAPAAGEQSIYLPTGEVGYCAIAFLPNADHNGDVLLIEGTGSEATEAAGDFLLSDQQLSSFQNLLHVSKLPYFEVLLKAPQVKGTPLSTSLVAYRIYPDLQ